MEAEILQTLKEIRGVLYVIAAIFFVGFSFLVISSFSASLSWRKVAKTSWQDQAMEYFDKGEFHELIKHCKTRELTHKYDPNVYYWQARVYRQQGDMEKSKELFELVAEIAPDWYKNYVQPFSGKN